MHRRDARPLRALLIAAGCLAVPPGATAQVEEAGADDSRISAMGGTGDTNYRGIRPAIAYNPVDHEYLVVWRGDHTTPGDDTFEIFGQRLDASTGSELGTDDFRISEMSTNGFVNGAFTPDVAHNPTTNQYLVVWSGIDDQYPAGVWRTFEIWGQLLDGATGAATGGDFLISDTGPDDPNYAAVTPAVVYNPTADEFLVVWSADDVLNEEFEIYGQRLDGTTGAAEGTDDFRISSMGGTGSAFYDANRPAVAYNVVDDEYLVAWDGDDTTAPLADNELEIWVQRLDGASGSELGGDVRITNIGPAGNAGYLVVDAEIAYSPHVNEYLVVFTATAFLPSMLPSELEIFAQRLDGETGAEVGTDDARITDAGGTMEAVYDFEQPDVAYSAAGNSYLVTFRGDDNVNGQMDGELDAFVQEIDAATGAEVGPNDLRISNMGPNGSVSFQAHLPVVACHNAGGCLVAWEADDNSGGMVSGEFEIFGQRLVPAALFEDDFESGNTAAWSSTSVEP